MRDARVNKPAVAAETSVWEQRGSGVNSDPTSGPKRQPHELETMILNLRDIVGADGGAPDS